MPKANAVTGSTYYVDEGADLTGVPEGFRLVGPGAPVEEEPDEDVYEDLDELINEPDALENEEEESETETDDSDGQETVTLNLG